ncbi:MAG: hypothetical protein IPI64_08570 [Chloracidobacterium sp.]|nr:hypothetical protein [Chloracidobacterium sp.]
MVAIEAGYYDAPGSPGPIITKTNSDGTFEVARRSEYYRLTVWKEGYAPSGCNNQICLNEILDVRLRKVKTDVAIPTIDKIYDLSKGAFSFRIGAAVDSDASDADIIIKVDPTSPTKMIISVPEGGGIAPTSNPGILDLDNTPSAPENYVKEISIDNTTLVAYFVQTRDGKYAKFRIMPDLNEYSNGQTKLEFTSCRIIWAFQSDGSRNLETVSPTKPPAVFMSDIN